jgi:hypothetical protein
MDNEQFDQFLESALKRKSKAPVDEASVNRVLHRISGSLPPQKQPLWRLPTVLLDWQFAPAWPRMAALACCAALGFFVGIAGLDRRFDDPSIAPAFVGGGGIGSITFEPDAFTGGRP